MRNKKNVIILFLVSFLQGLVFYYPIATLYRTSNGLTLMQISVIESVSFLVTMILEVPWGHLADRVGIKKVMVVANILYFGSKLIFYRADSFTLFLIERILLGVALAGLSGCDSSLLYLSSGEDSLKVFSWYSILGTLGLLCACFIYSVVLVDKYRLAASLTAIMYFIALLLTCLLEDIKEEKQNEQESPVHSKNLFANKHIIFFIMGTVLFGETIREVTLFIGQIRMMNVGIGGALFGVITFMMTLMEFSSVVTDTLVKKWGRERILYGSLLLATFLVLLIGALDNPWFVGVGLCLLSALPSVVGPIYAVIEQESVENGNRAKTISYYNAVGSFITIFLNLGFGYVGDRNNKLVYYLSVLVLMIALWNMRTFMRSKQEKRIK